MGAPELGCWLLAGADSNPFNTMSMGSPGFACGAQMAVYTRMRRQDGESHREVMLCTALEFVANVLTRMLMHTNNARTQY